MDEVQRHKVGWTDQQWAAIDAAVAMEVERVRVVDHIIPTTKVDENDKTVTIDRINALNRTIDDETTIPLPEISVQFQLDKQQVQQTELSRALALVRRSASDFARLEDAVLIRGLASIPGGGFQPDGMQLPPFSDIQRGKDRVPFDGLSADARNVAPFPQNHLVLERVGDAFEPPSYGPKIIRAVARAIVLLEEAGHMGPYHLILGNNAFIAALTPNVPNQPALVLPKDSVEPLLGGPIRRAPSMPEDEGVLVSVGGDPTDRVVAIEPTLRFIETTPQDRYRFRVYGVVALRRKEPEAVVRLQFRR